MKLALDPYMFRGTPLLELPGLVAELGYQWIELSPREDFLPFFNHARVNEIALTLKQCIADRRIGRDLGRDARNGLASELLVAGIEA